MTAKHRRRPAASATSTNTCRRDTDAWVEAGRQSVAGVEAVLERRKTILRETISELRTVATLMRHVGIRESVAHLDELALGLVALSIHSVLEIAELALATQREAIGALARGPRADGPRLPISG
jgi:hypothetical protein